MVAATYGHTGVQNAVLHDVLHDVLQTVNATQKSDHCQNSATCFSERTDSIVVIALPVAVNSDAD